LEVAVTPSAGGKCLFSYSRNPNWTVHLQGVVRFGDNIEDEWFIVFLLFELSKAFQDLIVR
jgi:hypothetical protein